MPAEVRPPSDLTDDFTIPENATRLSVHASIRRGDLYRRYDNPEWLFVTEDSSPALHGFSVLAAQSRFPVEARPVIFCRPRLVVRPTPRSEWYRYSSGPGIYGWTANSGDTSASTTSYNVCGTVTANSIYTDISRWQLTSPTITFTRTPSNR